MRTISLYIILFIINSYTLIKAQEKLKHEARSIFNETLIKEQVYFLSSDAMRGRETGSPEIEAAANFIADQFKKIGLISPPGINNYIQDVKLEKIIPANRGMVTLDSMIWTINKDFIIFQADNIDQEFRVVYVNYGLETDYRGIDVENKIVIVRGGDESGNNIMNIYHLTDDKMQIAIHHGAAGIIELIPDTSYPWKALVRRLGEEKTGLNTGEYHKFLYLWLNDGGKSVENKVEMLSGLNTHIKIEGLVRSAISGQNVIGILEGNDPVLKNEYILASAHYDHIGVGDPVQGDSIYNGARDNAIGTVALITAARYIKSSGSKRSVIFLACTGEEKGMLGSSWYALNPVIPLNRTFFNLNTDGAGYNDISMITILGLNRTTVDPVLDRAAGSFGLKVGGDPAPEQMLYDRSDNIIFSRKGIPSLSLSPGVNAFDDEIRKYYHNPKDEAGTINYSYITRYMGSFSYSLKFIADLPEKPFWLPGDNYEKAGLSLYGSRP